MMMSKASLFGDQGVLNEMSQKTAPDALKSLGRKVRNFDQAIWDAANIISVTIGNYYKFTQDDRLFGFMEEMGDRRFVEGSPKDRIWGVGIAWDNLLIENEDNWLGENRLGKCLDAARDMIRLFGREADAYSAYNHYIKIKKTEQMPTERRSPSL